ncbi:hypothetical protein [Minwuia sp.]|uniref:hypothetical protein n=1 Tax=Minwuia sp. TaxID=2493630 RepID=UPI003A92D7B2
MFIRKRVALTYPILMAAAEAAGPVARRTLSVLRPATLAIPLMMAIGAGGMASTAHAGGPKNCPPGLAKKNNGCLPPGLAKKRYAIGQPVPDDVRIIYVPADQYPDLPRPRDGHIYARVDGDLLLIAEATRRVVDAVVAVDAAARATRDD